MLSAPWQPLRLAASMSGGDLDKAAILATQAFVSRLDSEDRNTARRIVALELAQAAMALRERGIAVVFTDLAPGGPVWDTVNRELRKQGQEPLQHVGAIPGDWMRDGDLLLNGADNCSAVGNHGARDKSMDGAIGANSSAHPLHTLLCRMHGLGLHLPD